jgi:uncharacterized protein (TIGR02145 family)
MKLFKLLLLFVCALTFNSTNAQNLMNIHQGNGTLLQIPLESIDSVRFYTVPPPTIQKIFQSNGNILSIAVSDIDSITYTIPNSTALATISTQAVTVLSSSSAYAGGTITSDGGTTITQRGVCWSTSPNPTLANNFSVDGSGIGSYGSNLFPLQASTSYYVRAYAVNGEGTAYGNQLTFTTSSPSTSGSLPTITTSNIIYTDGLSAPCGGNITADGGLAVTARGVCWAIGTTPTINNSITNDGAGGGNYTSILTNLLPNTSYFVRAYATNDAGTAYGITLSVTTNGIPYITTNEINNITPYTATCGGTIITSGNIISQKGICWSANTNPTLNDSSTQDGGGSDSYTSDLIELLPATQYFVRAYCINGVGDIYYGNQIVFTSQSFFTQGNGVFYNGYNYPSVVLNNGQEWMAENLRTGYYRNGDQIPNFINGSSTTIGAYTVFNNDTLNDNITGKLYNWYAVADPRHICPTGWHEPTNVEYATLSTYLGGDAIAGGKLKTIGTIEDGTGLWSAPNTGATNEINFSALPGHFSAGSGFNIENTGYWWTSTPVSGVPAAWVRGVFYDSSLFNNANFSKLWGLSVRCIKD